MPSAAAKPSKQTFREQWELAREDVALLMQQGARAMVRLETLYEATLGEEAPEWTPAVRRERSA